MKYCKCNAGMTLIELLMVVGIVGIMGVLSVPNLLRARMSANEVAIVGSIKTLATAQTDYSINTQPHTYTSNLTCLGSGNGAGDVPFIDPNLASGLKSGYYITLNISDTADAKGSYWTWSATAWPAVYATTGIRSFYIDETAMIRGSDIEGVAGTIELRVYK